MSTVYAVSSGCYSDYSILAVFSTRELAEKYVAYQNGPESDGTEYANAGIEEWELDTPFTPTGRYACRVTVGTTKQHIYWYPDEDPTATTDIEWPGKYNKDTHVIGYGPTKEHARRSAAEMARAILAGTVVNPGGAP